MLNETSSPSKSLLTYSLLHVCALVISLVSLFTSGEQKCQTLTQSECVFSSCNSQVQFLIMQTNTLMFMVMILKLITEDMRYIS